MTLMGFNTIEINLVSSLKGYKKETFVKLFASVSAVSHRLTSRCFIIKCIVVHIYVFFWSRNKLRPVGLTAAAQVLDSLKYWEDRSANLSNYKEEKVAMKS